MAEIRVICPEDWVLLKRARLAALADAPEAFGKSIEEEGALEEKVWRSRARGEFGSLSCYNIVALDAEKEPVGMATGLPEEGQQQRIYLVSMWVAPSQRGTGLAKDLLDSVARWGRANGATDLYAGVKESNARAMAFYAREGFTRYHGDRPAHPAISCCGIVMHLTLVHQ